MDIHIFRNDEIPNKRNHQLHARSFALFAASLILFFGALTCFAWAAPAKLQQTNQRESETLITSGTQEPAYTGKIATASSSNPASTSARSSSSSSSSTVSSSTTSSSASMPSSAASPSESAQASSLAQSPAEQAARTDAEPDYTQMEPYEEQGAQSYHTVHHSAYQAVPVYTTIHHQKSTPREVIANGSTHIEWTACPVCGGQHDSSYNERIVDHVNEVFCAACGGVHETDYDEIVYDG